MKRLLLFYILAVVFSVSIYAQSNLTYGIKTGLNYNSNGDLNVFGGFAGLNDFFDSKSEMGYHVGTYAKYNIDKLYFKSELLFNNTSSSYDYNKSSSKYKIYTVEVPILIGYTIAKPVSIYIGPSSRFILDANFSSINLELDKTITLDFNFGLSLQLDKFGVDLRYTTGLSENKASNVNNLAVDGFGYAIDTKPTLVAFSLFYQIN